MEILFNNYSDNGEISYYFRITTLKIEKYPIILEINYLKLEKYFYDISIKRDNVIYKQNTA